MSQLADLIQRYHDAFNRRDHAMYDRIFTPDCVIEGPGVKLRGVDGARAFDQVWQTAMPDGQIVNLHKATGGHVVMCENRYRGTHTGPLAGADGVLAPSGHRFDEAYTAVFELEGERIKRQTLYFDRALVMKVLATDGNLATVQQLYAAFGRGDLPFILDRVADDVSWGIDSAAGVPAYGVRRGKDGVAAFAAGWAETVDFLRFEAHDFAALGEHVFNTLTYEARVKATGQIVKQSSMQHWTLAGGKVIRWRGYEDTAATGDAFRRTIGG